MGQLIGYVIGFFLLMAFVCVLMAWPTMALWNGCLVPAVSGVNEIGFWQALGLNFLSAIMFKSSSSSSSI